MRFVVAGELAGYRVSSGGVGDQWNNLAPIALTGLSQNQETAAQVLVALNAD